MNSPCQSRHKAPLPSNDLKKVVSSFVKYQPRLSINLPRTESELSTLIGLILYRLPPDNCKANIKIILKIDSTLTMNK
jgi:hypothetical protein